MVNVTVIMNKQAESIRTTTLVVVIVILHDCLVNLAVLEVGLVHQPVNDAWNGDSNVHGVFLELGIVLQVAALVEIGDVYEVPV